MKYLIALLVLVGCGGDGAPATPACSSVEYLGAWSAVGSGNALVFGDDCKLEIGAPSACRVKH